MMVDPPAPGAVLAQYLEGLSLADAAAKIGIGQAHLSNLIAYSTETSHRFQSKPCQ